MSISCSDYLKAHQKEINDLINLQKQIMNLNSTNFNDLLDLIINSEYVQEKSKFVQLLNSIQVGISIRPLSYELYFDLLEQISPQIKQYFSERELISIFPKRPSVLKLFEKKIIGIYTILELCQRQNYNFSYFAPEIKEFDNGLFESKIDEETKKTLKLDEMKKYRTKGQNSSLIAQFIRNDECENFQDYLSKTNTKIDSILPMSEYEQCRILNQKINLIDYAAFYGSIKIFKFLIMNKCSLSNKTSQFAVAGGNYEIIHLLENEKCSFKSCFEISIQFHRNEIYEYLIEKHSNNQFDSLYPSVQFYNVEIFYQNIEIFLKDEEKIESIRDSILSLCSIHGLLDFVHFICSINEIDINEKSYIAFLLNLN